MKLENQLIYQVFVRNYSKEGTFKEVEKDLPRLKELGVDIIYLLPIHPIGTESRKGTYGSPYAIKDYFAISPDLGNKDDFISLINKTHEHGMKIIMDMVFNHTSPDNVLVDSHPEYYFYKNGKRGNRVGDWSDIVDLDTLREDTQEYLVSVLKYWLSLGVDGFRFDVASTIPASFFKRAREAIGPEPFFLAECIDEGFAKYLISVNAIYETDETLNQYFDCLYNYNWLDILIRYLKGNDKLENIIKAIKEDNKDIVRLNCLENHDKDRIAHYFSKEKDLYEWMRFTFNLKGNMFIYMGQEYGIKHKPELFEKDPVVWPKEDNETYRLYKKLIKENKQRGKRENNIELKDGVVILNKEEYKL